MTYKKVSSYVPILDCVVQTNDFASYQDVKISNLSYAKLVSFFAEKNESCFCSSEVPL